MPRKPIDPALKVIEYFETAPLDAARLALAFCITLVTKRERRPHPDAPKRARKVNDDAAVTNHDGITLK